MKTRYALTHINRDGMRQLTRRNQGGNHFNTREAANSYLDGFTDSEINPEYVLARVYGGQAIGTFRIDPVDCYDHGDAMSVFVDDPEAPFQKANPERHTK